MKRNMILLVISASMVLPTEAQESTPKVVPATPLAAALPPATPHVVQIQLHVLDIKEQDHEQVAAKMKDFFPKTKTSTSGELTLSILGNDRDDRVDSMVKQLKLADLAEVITRPQLVTMSGRSGQIQIGQQSATATDAIGNGLTIACTPTAGVEHGQLRLAINYASQFDGKVKRQWSAEILTKPDDLIAFRHETDPTTLLLVKATSVTGFVPLRQPVAQVQNLQPVKAVARPSLVQNMLHLNNAVRGVKGATVAALEVDGDRFEIEVLLEDHLTIHELSTALDALKQYRIEAIQVHRVDDGAEVLMVGASAGAKENRTGNANDLERLRDEIRELKDDLRELTDRLQDEE